MTFDRWTSLFLWRLRPISFVGERNSISGKRPWVCQINLKKSPIAMLPCKVVFVGESGCGKTSIIRAIVYGARADQMTGQTVGYGTFPYDWDSPGRDPRHLEFWDTAGTEQFRSLMPTYLRGAQLCFLVFSLTERRSFESLGEWLKNVRDHLPDDVAICLVGNKSDIVGERVVESAEAERWAAGENMIYIETSAVTLEGVSELLESGMRKVSMPERVQADVAVPPPAPPERREKPQCC
jgi:small GTP-binding protein